MVAGDTIPLPAVAVSICKLQDLVVRRAKLNIYTDPPNFIDYAC